MKNITIILVLTLFTLTVIAGSNDLFAKKPKDDRAPWIVCKDDCNKAQDDCLQKCSPKKAKKAPDKKCTDDCKRKNKGCIEQCKSKYGIGK